MVTLAAVRSLEGINCCCSQTRMVKAIGQPVDNVIMH